jgi:hypothetical protein
MLYGIETLRIVEGTRNHLNNSQKSFFYKQQALILQQELQASGCVVDLIDNSPQ